MSANVEAKAEVLRLLYAQLTRLRVLRHNVETGQLTLDEFRRAKREVEIRFEEISGILKPTGTEH